LSLASLCNSEHLLRCSDGSLRAPSHDVSQLLPHLELHQAFADGPWVVEAADDQVVFAGVDGDLAADLIGWVNHCKLLS
jgi:hypothetical protein